MPKQWRLHLVQLVYTGSILADTLNWGLSRIKVAIFLHAITQEEKSSLKIYLCMK